MNREEEQDGEVDPFYKTQKLLETFAYKLNNCSYVDVNNTE